MALQSCSGASNQNLERRPAIAIRFPWSEATSMCLLIHPCCNLMFRGSTELRASQNTTALEACLEYRIQASTLQDNVVPRHHTFGGSLLRPLYLRKPNILYHKIIPHYNLCVVCLLQHSNFKSSLTQSKHICLMWTITNNKSL